MSKMKGLAYGAPRWLVEALGDEWRDGMFYDLMNYRDAGFDHVRTYRKRIALSQTYEAKGDELGQTLMKLTERGIRVRVWGISPYFPGHTFSMVMWRAEDEALAIEVMEKMHEPFAQSEQPISGQKW
jgi:hypothetical protein